MRPLNFSKLAPGSRHLVTIFKQFLQSRRNAHRRRKRAKHGNGHFVGDHIEKHGAFAVRFNNVSMPPGSKRALDLNIFKRPGRIISSVLGHPPDAKDAEDAGFDDRA